MPEKLKNILAKLEGNAAAVVKNCALLSLWPQVVDENISKNTAPVKINNRVLYVSTAAPVWAQELSLLKKKIVDKFNQEAGGEVILDIRFKTAGGL